MAYASIPALVALIFKLIVIVYAARSPTKTLVTRLFLTLLVVLTVLNIVEFCLLNYLPSHGLTPDANALGFAYVALLLLAGTLTLHLSIALSLEEQSLANRRWFVALLYAPVCVLEYLLLFTDKLVLGFTPFLSYSILRNPGPWYFLVEGFAVLYLSACLAILAYGARSSRPALLRIRNRLWWLGLSPMVLFLIYIVIVDYIGGVRLSAPFHLPIAITFFLLVTTYATHERPRPGGFYRFLYRLFDVEFYVPWSKVRRRKTALYEKVRTMIAELGDLHSIKDIAKRLADIFQCPIVWFVGAQPVASPSGMAKDMTRFPRDRLPHTEGLLMAHAIARTLPETHALMKRHGVAAIVPFHAHSRAASWMLLGEPFVEQVYTPLDLEMVETLFGRIAAHLIDEQVRAESLLTRSDRKQQRLRTRLAETCEQLKLAQKRLETLEQQDPDAKTRFPSFPIDDDLAPAIVASAETGPRRKLDDHVADFEKRLIARALESCGGNQARAAQILGLRPNTLHYKIERYGLYDLKKTS